MNFLVFVILFSLVNSASWDVTTDEWIWIGASDEEFQPRTFIKGNRLILHNKKVTRHLAAIICNGLSGDLLAINIVPLAHMIADLMGSGKMLFDTMWTSGILHKNELGKEEWSWYFPNREKKYEPIGKTIRQFFVDDLPVPDVDNSRTCLGIGRDNHSKPSLRPLSCTALRPFICQRAWDYVPDHTTHGGWIKIGMRLFKIFPKKLTYEQSAVYCRVMSDLPSDLATVVSTQAANILARYMLIGRPSIEAAWIGAKWDEEENAYAFYPEKLVLSETTESNTSYPPWLTGQMRKSGGCLMLDRHLSDKVAFVEAKCSSKRARICYTKIYNYSKPPSEDIIFDKWGYRLILQLSNWQESFEFCNMWSEYDARLLEIIEKEQRPEVLYVMGEIEIEVRHIWLGAKYINDTWRWTYEKKEVDKSILFKWIHNQTYTHSVDDHYKCLNMDRENHVIGLFYGTDCEFYQYFICMFPKEGLERLKRHETLEEKNDN